MPPKRILFVDDDEDTCLAMTLFLGSGGYEVITARTVADGLNLAESGCFDLYLLDNRLPDGTGLELCRRIRRFDSRNPILFCSGAILESDQQQALAAGAQDYLAKPCDLDELEEAIRRLLKNLPAGLVA